MSIEREWKRLLDEAGWRKLRAWATERGAVLGEREQTNYYLDTPAGHLAAERMLLRLREAGGSWELTFKRGLPGAASPEASREGAAVREEIECPVDAALALRWLADPSAILAATDDLPPLAALRAHATEVPALVLTGTLVTHRTRIRSPSGALVLELDHSRYGEGDDSAEDYELECEGEDLAVVAEEVTALLADLGIEHRPSTLPKVARMYATQGR